MKNIFILSTLVILSACASPQVTVTSEVTVTSTPLPPETPIPTPTFHPQFIALQETIAASGKRFTLQADGTIQDGTETIPGLTVAPDGTMSLTVDGETVILDPADVGVEEGDKLTVITEDGKKWEWDESVGWIESFTPAQLEWKNLFETNGYTFSNDQVVAPNGVLVEGLHMNGDILVMTYAFPELGGDKIDITLTDDGIRFGYNLALDTIRFKTDGTLDMPGLRFDGEQVVQEKVLYNGKETKETLLPIEVVIELIRRDTAAFVEKYGDSVLEDDSEMRAASGARSRSLTGNTGLSDRTTTFKGMTFTRAVDGVYSNEFQYVDTENKISIIPTLFYAYQELVDGQSMVTWDTVDGKQVWYMVDGFLGNTQYYKKNGVTPFIVEQED